MMISREYSALFTLSVILLFQLQCAHVVTSFVLTNQGPAPSQVCLSASRGFGSSKNQPKASKKGKPQAGNSFQVAAIRNPAEAKRILELYGGDVQQGTVRRINEARAKLEQFNPLLGEAMKLKEERVRWETSISGLGVLQQAEIPSELWEVERRRNRRLEELADVSECFRLEIVF